MRNDPLADIDIAIVDEPALDDRDESASRPTPASLIEPLELPRPD